MQAPAVVTALTEAIYETTQHPIDLPIVGNAVLDMRQRLREVYGSAPALQLRKLPGGMAELDLLVQGLRLINADLFTGTGQDQIEIISKLARHERVSQPTLPIWKAQASCSAMFMPAYACVLARLGRMPMILTLLSGSLQNNDAVTNRSWSPC